MLPEDQDRVVIVLVRARNPSNIGAVARAMYDLGFSKLRIVNEFPVPFAAAKSAVDASRVLDAAQEFQTVADSVADCTQVFGTTAVGERVLEHPLHLLPEAAHMIRSELKAQPESKIALLFGSEKTGLSNVELSHCNALLTIPMNPRADHDEPARHLSMNLGQAVAVCLYALIQSQPPLLKPFTGCDFPASLAHQERLTQLLRDVLDRSGYTRRHPANAREENIRRLVLRMALKHTDAPIWTGILRQIEYALCDSSTAAKSTAHSSEEMTPE